MIVTDIAPIDQKKKRVCINESYTFPLYLSEIKKFHLQIGTEVSEASFQEIQNLLRRRLQDRILYYITDCDHSERDIRRKMAGAGYPQEVLDEVMDHLKECHMIDDERFARFYMESLSSGKGKNRNYIVQKLFEKGISKDIIDDVMQDFQVDEFALLLVEVRKKGYAPEKVNGLLPKERQRLYASLLRKGYSPTEVNKLFHSTDFYDEPDASDFFCD